MADGPYWISLHGRPGTRSPFWRHQHWEWVGDIDGKLLEGNCCRGGVFHHSSTCSKNFMGFSEATLLWGRESTSLFFNLSGHLWSGIGWEDALALTGKETAHMAQVAWPPVDLLAFCLVLTIAEDNFCKQMLVQIWLCQACVILIPKQIACLGMELFAQQ